MVPGPGKVPEQISSFAFYMKYDPVLLVLGAYKFPLPDNSVPGHLKNLSSLCVGGISPQASADGEQHRGLAAPVGRISLPQIFHTVLVLDGA